MALSLQDIEELFARRGAEQYAGEPVTQLEHALQCAMLAESAGAAGPPRRCWCTSASAIADSASSASVLSRPSSTTRAESTLPCR